MGGSVPSVQLTCQKVKWGLDANCRITTGGKQEPNRETRVDLRCISWSSIQFSFYNNINIYKFATWLVYYAVWDRNRSVDVNAISFHVSKSKMSSVNNNNNNSVDTVTAAATAIVSAESRPQPAAVVQVDIWLL